MQEKSKRLFVKITWSFLRTVSSCFAAKDTLFPSGPWLGGRAQGV